MGHYSISDPLTWQSCLVHCLTHIFPWTSKKFWPPYFHMIFPYYPCYGGNSLAGPTVLRTFKYDKLYFEGNHPPIFQILCGYPVFRSHTAAKPNAQSKSHSLYWVSSVCKICLDWACGLFTFLTGGGRKGHQILTWVSSHHQPYSYWIGTIHTSLWMEFLQYLVFCKLFLQIGWWNCKTISKLTRIYIPINGFSCLGVQGVGKNHHYFLGHGDTHNTLYYLHCSDEPSTHSHWSSSCESDSPIQVLPFILEVLWRKLWREKGNSCWTYAIIFLFCPLGI